MTQWSPQANILINQDRRACLGGFGNSEIIGASAHLGIADPSSWGESITCVLRYYWASPERLEDERLTKESDVYALGMVIYEVRLFASK